MTKCPCEECKKNKMCGGADCKKFTIWFKESWRTVVAPFREILKKRDAR